MVDPRDFIDPDAAPELYEELIQARTDVSNLLAILRAHEETTEDPIDDEDAAVVNETARTYQVPSPALAKARGESPDAKI